jgi:hypothetical protein
MRSVRLAPGEHALWNGLHGMTDPSEFEAMNLSGLSHRCRQESELFFRRQSYDPRFCFELFRRAILEQNNDAWEVIHQQYRLMVLSWVKRHPLSANLDEVEDYFVNRAFEKMWAALTPKKFADFDDLKSVLRYLQLCVNSCIVDHMRAKEETVLLDEGIEPAIAGYHERPSMEDRVARRMQGQALWDWLSQRLKSDQEHTVIYAMFVLALKPREVLEMFRSEFDSVEEIYAIKENVLARLRRDPELARIVSETA